ncbi:MAG: 1-phosphofructokinase [Halococcoides sp.]
MILTITPNPAVDQTVQIDEDLEAGRVQRSTGAQFDSGGNGINLSQFLRAFDAETVATGITGGFTGYFIKQDLAEYDVPTDFVSTDDPTRLNTTVHAAGKEYKLNQSGPEVESDIVEEIIATAREHDPEILNVGGSLPPGLDSEAVDRIAAAGDWETALDVHGEHLPDLTNGAEYVKPNAVELESATGIAVESIDDCAKAARDLQEMGFERVLASMGADGAMLVTPEETLYAPALDVDAVDTVGAGDSMFAGALWAYEQGWSDEDALKAAVSVSSQVVETHGPSARDLDPESRMDEVRLWSMR